MSRLIDEDKLLLDIIDRGVDHIQTDDYAEICQIIAEQPTLEPQGEWIAVFDKIRAEIEQEYKDESEHPYGQGLRRTIEIIDKYKAESEEVWEV